MPVTDIDNEVEVIDIVTVPDTDSIVTVNISDNIVTVADTDNEVEATDIVTVNEKEEIPPCPVISEAALQNGLNDDMDLLLSLTTTDEIPRAQQVDLLTSELEEPAARSNDVENIGRAGEKPNKQIPSPGFNFRH